MLDMFSCSVPVKDSNMSYQLLIVLATGALITAAMHWRQRKARLQLAVSGTLESNSDLVLRELCSRDVDRGFLGLVAQLTKVGDVSHQRFRRRFRELQSTGRIIVAVVHDVAKDRILAAGTLLVEPKFIHECSAVGHIEDVVVDSVCRGMQLGTTMVKALIQTAEASGCYKVILDCDEENVAFYQKCSMQRKGVQMAEYFDG